VFMHHHQVRQRGGNSKKPMPMYICRCTSLQCRCRSSDRRSLLKGNGRRAQHSTMLKAPRRRRLSGRRASGLARCAHEPRFQLGHRCRRQSSNRHLRIMCVCSSEAHLALPKSERVVVDSVKAQEPSPSRVRKETACPLKLKSEPPRTCAYRWRRGGEQIASWRGAGHLPCRRLQPSQRSSPSLASAAPGTANWARRGLPWPCLIIQGLN